MMPVHLSRAVTRNLGCSFSSIRESNVIGGKVHLAGENLLKQCVKTSYHQRRKYSKPAASSDSDTVTIGNQTFPRDSWTNVTPNILNKVGQNLQNQKNHPINLIKRRIQNYFYKSFLNKSGNPLFTVFDNLSPCVTVKQNFDYLLIGEDHPMRSPKDTYYINKDNVLRAHTSAHQVDLMHMGFDAFLALGDVYRRDTIDASHYPVFHQMEGVRLLTRHEIFGENEERRLFRSGERTESMQEFHTPEAVLFMEDDLKKTLQGLAKWLFGPDIETQWVDAYFPFTHPSWELEIRYQDKWLEVLGCGIMEQRLLHTAGADSRIGWAFGLGLDRLAMKLYQIPDIRLFWSRDSGFLSQFNVDDPETPITYKPVSEYPQCINDISFWIPKGFNMNDFCELVRSEGGDLVEQVELIDQFFHPKKKRTSHCYRIVYRHMEKTLTKEEANVIHQRISELSEKLLHVELR